MCVSYCKKKIRLQNIGIKGIGEIVKIVAKKSCKNIWWIMKKAATLQPQNRKVLWLLNATFSGWKSTSHRGLEKSLKKVIKKFGGKEKSFYLCTRNSNEVG